MPEKAVYAIEAHSPQLIDGVFRRRQVIVTFTASLSWYLMVKVSCATGAWKYPLTLYYGTGFTIRYG